MNPVELHRARSVDDVDALVEAWLEVLADDARLELQQPGALV